MHQTRKESSVKLPIRRKGTKYLARARSHLKDSVPVVIAVRDMLKLARTSREVKKMIHEKMLKLNGRLVIDERDSIQLFNIFEADKKYELSILPTGKFFFKDAGKGNERLCKIINKTLVKDGKIQLNLHDGTNVLSNDKKFKTGDSIYFDLSGKIKTHVTLEKGKEIFVVSGKYHGRNSKIDKLEAGKVYVKLNGKETILNKESVFVL